MRQFAHAVNIITRGVPVVSEAERQRLKMEKKSRKAEIKAGKKGG
jgi:hypothetical protein